MFPDIFASSGRKSGLLSWTHYRALLQIHDPEARAWYENEAFSETWSARTLQQNISTQYYYRLLKSQDKRPVKEEMLSLTSKYQQDRYPPLLINMEKMFLK
jgi:predicted nuclease of restriction endonuclease-like (RecB) superfamily